MWKWYFSFEWWEKSEKSEGKRKEKKRKGELWKRIDRARLKLWSAYTVAQSCPNVFILFKNSIIKLEINFVKIMKIFEYKLVHLSYKTNQ